VLRFSLGLSFLKNYLVRVRPVMVRIIRKIRG